MKTLRLRAILKSLGYNMKIDLLNETVYENKSGDMIYLRLEQSTYYINLKYYGKEYASKQLFKYLYHLDKV